MSSILADPQIREAYELIEAFTTMLWERQGKRLDAWLQKVEEQGDNRVSGERAGIMTISIFLLFFIVYNSVHFYA